MSEQDMNKIRLLAEGHKLEPRKEAWEKLRSKLNTRKDKNRIISYRNISIAAILISILSISVVFSLYLEKHNPNVFASNEIYRPIIFEELQSDEDDPFYNIKNIEELHNAYLKIGFE